MNIQAEKIELVKLLLDTDSPKVIQSIKQIFKTENPTDFWDELTKEEQAEIKQGIQDIEDGNVKDYNAFMANHR